MHIGSLSDLRVFGNNSTIASQPYVVFPFISIANFGERNKPQHYQTEGTGFFIRKSGLFITAKHVPYMNEKILKTFIGIHDHFGTVSVRHVKTIALHPKADICVGYFDIHDVKNKQIYNPEILYQHLVPNFESTKIDDRVENFGYGNSLILHQEKNMQLGKFPCQWSEGKVTQLYPDGRDSSLLIGSTVETTLKTIGKASGGPVFNDHGEVIGVNSTSFDGDYPISYFTPINTILEMELKTNFWGKMKISKLFYPKGKP